MNTLYCCRAGDLFSDAHTISSQRHRAFALAEAQIHDAPDRLCDVVHVALTVQWDIAQQRLRDTCATTQTDLPLHDAWAHLGFSGNGLVAHEFAHQWFGNLVYACVTWMGGCSAALCAYARLLVEEAPGSDCNQVGPLNCMNGVRRSRWWKSRRDDTPGTPHVIIATRWATHGNAGAHVLPQPSSI